jgi:hypothetical protein
MAWWSPYLTFFHTFSFTSFLLHSFAHSSLTLSLFLSLFLNFFSFLGRLLYALSTNAIFWCGGPPVY